ncbi:unnamed protein product [Rhodiola kirilowii]
MDLREGQNITQPPLLEGNKYGYWRVRMKAFLKSQDEAVWEAVEQGWTHPVTTDKEGKVSLLAKDKWIEVHKNAEAGNILKTAHEGTTKAVHKNAEAGNIL